MVNVRSKSLSFFFPSLLSKEKIIIQAWSRRNTKFGLAQPTHPLNEEAPQCRSLCSYDSAGAALKLHYGRSDLFDTNTSIPIVLLPNTVEVPVRQFPILKRVRRNQKLEDYCLIYALFVQVVSGVCLLVRFIYDLFDADLLSVSGSVTGSAQLMT